MKGGGDYVVELLIILCCVFSKLKSWGWRRFFKPIADLAK